MLSHTTKFTGFFLLLVSFLPLPASAQNFGVLDLSHGHQHDHTQQQENRRITSTPSGVLEPISFDFSETGATADPTGLFTEGELEEGGSTVQPPIWFSTFPVDGGEVTMAILVDRWCGAQECPFRFRLEAAGGSMTLNSHFGQNYGMICQDIDSMVVDPIDLTVTACGAIIDLKEAR